MNLSKSLLHYSKNKSARVWVQICWLCPEKYIPSTECFIYWDYDAFVNSLFIADQVLADVNLIWANCRAYNEEGAPILDDCQAAESTFQERWLLSGLPAENLLNKPPIEQVLIAQSEAEPKLKVSLSSS